MKHRTLLTHWRKSKNKRVGIAFDEKRKSYILTFKRLKEKDEEIQEVYDINSIIHVEIIRNKIVKSTFQISQAAAEMVFLLLHELIIKQ